MPYMLAVNLIVFLENHFRKRIKGNKKKAHHKQKEYDQGKFFLHSLIVSLITHCEAIGYSCKGLIISNLFIFIPRRYYSYRLKRK